MAMNTDANRVEQLRLRVSKLERTIAKLVATLVPGADRDTMRSANSLLLERLERDEPIFSEESSQQLIDHLVDLILEQRAQASARALEEEPDQAPDAFAQFSEAQARFERKTHELTFRLEELTHENDKLRAETHEWFSLFSLGLDLREAALRRIIPLHVYLSDSSERSTQTISMALDSLVNAFGFELADEYPERRGSWYKRWLARSQDLLNEEEVLDRLRKIEKAVELKQLDLPQAEINKSQAQAVSELIDSVADLPTATIQVGNILLEKKNSADGPTVTVRTLTPGELLAFSKDNAARAEDDKAPSLQRAESVEANKTDRGGEYGDAGFTRRLPPNG